MNLQAELIKNEMTNEFEDNDESSEKIAGKLFAGDHGQLDLPARRVLVHLISGPFIDSKHHSKLWRALITYELVIRSRLADIFLELVIDQEQQVAFTRQAETDELDAPILLRRTHLTFIYSVLLLYLRQLLSESDTQGERAVVSENDINEQLMLYEKAANTDRAGFKRKINAAIETARKHNVLSRIPAAKDRYEISPILKLLFSAEQVIALKQQYQRLLAGEELALNNLTEEASDEFHE